MAASYPWARLAYLSKKARKLLDEAGYPDVKIMASNSLDEYIIRDLLLQGAKLDISTTSSKTRMALGMPDFKTL